MFHYHPPVWDSRSIKNNREPIVEQILGFEGDVVTIFHTPSAKNLSTHVIIIIHQYKNPNNQSGIVFLNPLSFFYDFT